MNRLTHRVSRLAARARERDDSHNNLMRTMCRTVCALDERIMLVEPGDTDPATYADIEWSRAMAKGDFALAEKLRKEFPHPEPPPEIAADPKKHAPWLMAGCPERSRARERALAAAERRVRRATRNERAAQAALSNRTTRRKQP
ncbi:MAG: hypothetical protein JNM80_10405 [Phycisphaerae bacterium]|nr:hypothetical protein [Phycisphaerae bacterium]